MLFSFFFRYYSKRKIIILFPKFINNKKNSPNIFPNLNHLLIPPNRIIPNYSFVPIKTNKFPCVHTHTHTRVSTNIVTRHVSFTFNLSNKTKSITHAKNTTRMSPEHFHLYYLIVALPACYYLSPPFTWIPSFSPLFLFLLPCSRTHLIVHEFPPHSWRRTTVNTHLLDQPASSLASYSTLWPPTSKRRPGLWNIPTNMWLVLDNNKTNLRLYKLVVLDFWIKFVNSLYCF